MAHEARNAAGRDDARPKRASSWKNERPADSPRGWPRIPRGGRIEADSDHLRNERNRVAMLSKQTKDKQVLARELQLIR